MENKKDVKRVGVKEWILVGATVVQLVLTVVAKMGGVRADMRVTMTEILKGFAAVDTKALWKEKLRVHDWVPLMVEKLAMLMVVNSGHELVVKMVVLKVDWKETVPTVVLMAVQKALIVVAGKENPLDENWDSLTARQLANL